MLDVWLRWERGVSSKRSFVVEGMMAVVALFTVTVTVTLCSFIFSFKSVALFEMRIAW